MHLSSKGIFKSWNEGCSSKITCRAVVHSPRHMPYLSPAADRTTVKNGLFPKFAGIQQVSVTFWQYSAKMMLHQYSLSSES